MAAESFWPMYLQTCLQALVEVQAGDRTHDHLCGEHSTAYHSATPVWLQKEVNLLNNSCDCSP